jgi:type IV secretory pathway TrbF-like protein
LNNRQGYQPRGKAIGGSSAINAIIRGHRSDYDDWAASGSARIQASNWRLMAFGCLLLSGGLASGLISQSVRGTVTPWVVQVDRFGQAQAVAPAESSYQLTDPQIAFHLARFIEDVRRLPTDGVVLRQDWLRAYDFTTDRGAAALNKYARSNDPFANLGKLQISVEVSSVIRASPASFRVAWFQHVYENGSLSTTERWTAILTVVIDTPRDADRDCRSALHRRIPAH